MRRQVQQYLVGRCRDQFETLARVHVGDIRACVGALEILVAAEFLVLTRRGGHQRRHPVRLA